MKKATLVLFALFFLSFSLFCQKKIQGEFIYNLDLDKIEDPFSLSSVDDFKTESTEYEKVVVKELLEEARWVFSGMIYGFNIEYSPSDIKRSVDRYYKISLISEIPFGDANLEVFDVFLEDHYLHLFIRYELNEYQSRRLEYWNSGIFNSISSYGFAPLYETESRKSAIEDGIRIALEDMLKPNEYNKPSLIEAEVLLRFAPSITIDSGQNRARVNLRAYIKNVQHYRLNN